jgi:hypothetical protein
MTTQAQIQAINAGGPVVQVLIPGFQGPNGLSAYEHAVALGYTGTLEQWLVSLTGPIGPIGATGEAGANFTLIAVDEFDQPIFPETSVDGQGAYAADIDTFYICIDGGSPGTWEAAADVAGSVFNIYKPLIDEAGPLADRDAFDDEPVGFPFLDTDAQVVYVREGAAGNWSDGIPFRGPAGNTVRSSDGPPDFLDGVDGDYNIDYTNWDIYGPKASGSWGAARSLDFPAEEALAAAEAAADAAAEKMPLAGGTFTGDVIFDTTGATQLPIGTTAERPGTPSVGLIRFNSDLGQFEGGDGLLFKPIAGAAKGGGPDAVFLENDSVVTTDYTLGAGKNAVSAGPITINSGATVTIPSGSVWTIV